MRIIIASDIHGDAVCCEKLLEIAKAEKAEKILLLGDLLYHGPRNDLPAGYNPKAVIDLLNSVADKLLCVRGNCDTEVDQMVLSFPILSDTAYFYDGDGKKTLFMSHGHKYSPEKLPPLDKDTIFLSGHTHVLGFFQTESNLCMNPGSTSIPKGGNPCSYAIYENGIFEIRDFDGNLLKKRDVN